jgi:hypothetical protein
LVTAQVTQPAAFGKWLLGTALMPGGAGDFAGAKGDVVTAPLGSVT